MGQIQLPLPDFSNQVLLEHTHPTDFQIFSLCFCTIVTEFSGGDKIEWFQQSTIKPEKPKYLLFSSLRKIFTNP